MKDTPEGCNLKEENIERICKEYNLLPGTLYHFGKLGLLTGREFVEAFINTLEGAGFTVGIPLTIIEGKIYIGERGAEVNGRVITDVIWNRYLNEGIKEVRVTIEPISDSSEETKNED